MMKSEQQRFARKKNALRKSASRHACVLSFVGAILSVGWAPEHAAAHGNSSEAGAGERDQIFGGSPALGLRDPSRAAPKARKSPAIRLAHAIVVRTSPAQGGVAAENIGKVEVWYDAGIRDAFAALAVVSESGERVDKRDAAIDSADPAHVSVSVNPLVPGKYTVRYRALSADGHLVSGAWDFEVRP